LNFQNKHVKEAYSLGFIDPLPALIVSFCLLALMLYKRVNLGITLNVTALLLAVLSLDWQQIPTVIYQTSVEPLTVSIVLATFGIMLLSQLYKETGFITKLSESLGGVIKNSKVILSLLPAVIGFLPVAGGALMSAPLVDSEAEKLKLTPVKKAYVNLWFRHTIFPLYPLSQVLILAVGLMQTSMFSIIVRQIPVVVVMVVVGYIISFWKIPNPKNEERNANSHGRSDYKTFIVSFLPILVTIFVAISLQLAGFGMAKQGFDVLIAIFIGIIVLIAIVRPGLGVFAKPLRSWGIYGVTFAAYGAFFLANVMKASGIAGIFETLAGENVDATLLLVGVPAALGFLTASALGGLSLAVPILGGIVALSSNIPKTASLIYMSAYLGYVVAPTHLCFSFTAEYFKCPLSRLYKYLIPSFIASLSAAVLMYLLV